MNIFKGKLKVIDMTLRVCISVLTLMASNAIASVSVPATSGTGDFRVTWTNSASSTTSSCNGNAYEVKEYKNGSYQRQLNISSTSQKYVNIYDRVEATYRYDVKYRSCSGSAKSMLTAGSATVLVYESSINHGFTTTGYGPSISYGSNDETIGLTPGSFRVDESGAATYSIPLSLAPGRAGVQPQVSLNYSSSNKSDGPMGIGWSIGATSSISRCPQNKFFDGEDHVRGLQYDSEDRLCLDGQRLLHNSGTHLRGGATYIKSVDDQSIITAHGGSSSSGPEYFTVENKAGETHYYGEVSGLYLQNIHGTVIQDTSDAFVEPGGYADGSIAKSYAIKAIVDSKNNYILFNYDKDTQAGTFYLDSIDYAGNTASVSYSQPFARVEFEYDDYDKGFKGYGPKGSYYNHNKILTAIHNTVDNENYRSYFVDYEADVSKFIEESTLVESITECADAGRQICRNPTEFNWNRRDLSTASMTWECDTEPGMQSFCRWVPDDTDFEAFDTTSTAYSGAKSTEYTLIFDIDGNGVDDFVYPDGSQWKARLMKAFDSAETVTLGNGTTGKEHALTIDFNGDGVRDLLYASSESSNWKVVSYVPGTNTSEICEQGTYCTEVEYQSSKINRDLGVKATGLDSQVQVMDVNGDSFEDIVFRDGNQIKTYLNNDGDDTFSSAKLLYTYPSSGINDYDMIGTKDATANLKYSSGIDVNGDGATDLIAKATTTSTYCRSSSGQMLFASSQGECEYDLNGTWVVSTATKYELFIASKSPTSGEPTLLLQSVIGGSSMSTVRFGDLNGDFITDIMYVRGTAWYYRLGNGVGFSPEKSMGLATDSTKKLLNRFVDLNGDGRIDVLHATASNKWAIYFSRPTENIEDIDFEHRGYQNFESNPYNMQFADVSGSGNLELLTATSSTWKTNYQRGSGQYNTVKEVVNGFGVSTHVQYMPLTIDEVNFGKVSDNLIDSETFSPRRGQFVVRFVGDEIAGYGNPFSSDHGRAAIYYEYAGLLIHKEGLGSLGFQAIKTFDYLTKIETTTEYNQDYGASSYVLRGMPIQTNSKKGEVTLSSATNTLAVKNSGSGFFGVIENTVEQSYQYNSNGTSTALSEVDSTFGYSSWGNLTTSEIIATDLTTSGTSLTTLTVNEYGTSNEYKRLARLTNTTVTKTRKNEGVTLPTVTRESSFTYNSDLMLETTTRSPTDSQNKQVTTYDYDDYGNKISTIIVANVKDTSSSQTRKTTTEYGPKGRYVKYKKDSLNYNQYYKYNNTSSSSVSGVIDSISVRNQNYLYTKSTLNAFGEVKLIDYPDSRFKSIEKRYCDSSCSLDGYYIQRVAETGKPDKEVVFDKYGMEIETRVVSFDGSTSVVTTTYDEYGRKESTSRPNNPALTTDFVYDDIGRVERVTNPDGSYKTLEYDGANEIATNEVGQKTITVKNGLGETIEVEDNEGNTVEFTYDAFGNLLTSETKADGKSSIITNEFDYLGRKTSTDDPIKGEWTYKYNGFDQIYSQTNAENDKFTFTYDTLGRKTKSYNSEEGTLCWIYGTSSTYKERNKLVETAKYDGANATCGSGTPTVKTEFSFDYLGRLDDKVSTIDGVKYTESQTYDSSSRPLVTSFTNTLSSFSVETLYTVDGYLKARVNNETGYVLERIDSMNDSGQVTGITYGNGVEGQYDFEGDTGRLSDVDFIGDSSLFNLDLTYYNNGDLHTKRSKYYSGDAADYTETFIYDDVSRLKNRNISVTTTNPALPSSFTGNQTYTYDGFGNITSKKGFGTNGTSTGYYKYSSTDVHRLEAIYKYSSRTGSTYNNFSGKYDNNGNIENDGVRTFTYSSFDLPTYISSSTASATMKYGVNRQLYYKSESKKENGLNATYTRTYVGGYEKTIRSGGYGSLTEHKYYIGNAIVTKRSNLTDEILYMHKDSQGSVVLVTNHDGDLVSQSIYDPWGKSTTLYTDSEYSSFDSLVPTERGYTSHRMMNDLNIIHMNGRIYDPTFGRFLQADPHIQAPTNTQNYNRYSYVLNNPMSYTDPSGYFFKALFKAIGSNQWLSTTISIGLFFVPGCQSGACSAAFNAATTYAVTGSLKAAAIGAFATAISPGGMSAGAFLARGVMGGIASRALGGKFGHGFISAGAGGAAGGMQNPWGRILVSAVIGGTVSELTGGKFRNGALSAAFATAVQAGFNGDFSLDIVINAKGGGVPSKSTGEGLPSKLKVKLKTALDKGEYDVAAELAAEYLGIDLDRATDLIFKPNSIGTYGSIDGAGVVTIARSGLYSPEAFVSTLGHEFVHVEQFHRGLIHDNYDNMQQLNLNEAEAHKWEIDNVHRTGFTGGLRQNKQYYKYHFDRLNQKNWWKFTQVERSFKAY